MRLAKIHFISGSLGITEKNERATIIVCLLSLPHKSHLKLMCLVSYAEKKFYPKAECKILTWDH